MLLPGSRNVTNSTRLLTAMKYSHKIIMHICNAICIRIRLRARSDAAIILSFDRYLVTIHYDSLSHCTLL